MRKTRKVIVVVVAALLLLAGAAAGVHGYMTWQRAQDVLPVVTEPDAALPKAPTAHFLDLDVGTTTLEEAEVVYRGKGIECKDSSMRALLNLKREDVKKKQAEAEANGDDPDGVTGASLIGHRSKREQNPQVRLQCKAPVEAFKDRARSPGDALYWLLIFDSAKLPLRHTSVQRQFKDEEQALEEFTGAVDAMTTHFGAPTTVRPPAQATASDPFPSGTTSLVEWRFSDVLAQVQATHLLGTVRVVERVEVPWPVRSDAPTLRMNAH